MLVHYLSKGTMFYFLTVRTMENDGRYEELLLTGRVADGVDWGWMEFCENDGAYRQMHLTNGCPCVFTIGWSQYCCPWLVPDSNVIGWKCLFHATSILLVGNEYLSIALRVSTAMELVLNDGYYKNNFRHYSDLTGVSYDDAVADVIHPYRESSMWEMQALTEVS